MYLRIYKQRKDMMLKMVVLVRLLPCFLILFIYVFLKDKIHILYRIRALYVAQTIKIKTGLNLRNLILILH